jgi:hypothetical protein
LSSDGITKNETERPALPGPVGLCAGCGREHKIQPDQTCPWDGDEQLQALNGVGRDPPRPRENRRQKRLFWIRDFKARHGRIGHSQPRVVDRREDLIPRLGPRALAPRGKSVYEISRLSLPQIGFL